MTTLSEYLRPMLIVETEEIIRQSKTISLVEIERLKVLMKEIETKKLGLGDKEWRELSNIAKVHIPPEWLEAGRRL